MTPLTTLFTTVCRPKPIPTPNALRIMVSLSTGNPAIIKARIIPEVIIAIRTSKSQLPNLLVLDPVAEVLDSEVTNATIFASVVARKITKKNKKILS